MSSLHVTHVLITLAAGGAERMLQGLVAARPVGDRARIVCLDEEGALATALREAGAEVQALQVRRRPWRLADLPRVIAATRPDVVQTWMHAADLLGGVAARLGTHSPVVWGLHQGAFDPAIAGQRRALRWARACARLSSSVPSAIVCCSEATRRAHRGLGYHESRLRVIENGVDHLAFQPDTEARAAFRARLGLDEKVLVIGAVGRAHPEKDWPNLLEAAARVAAHVPGVQFALCGEGVEPSRGPFAGRAVTPRGHLQLLGRIEAMPSFFAACDLFVSASAAEAFPLSVGEAMAAALPCVVTDVGDAARLVGDAGIVVPRRDAGALARAIIGLAGDHGLRRRLGTAARERIATHFSLARAAARYRALHLEVAA